jgi:hypothetical protein
LRRPDGLCVCGGQSPSKRISIRARDDCGGIWRGCASSFIAHRPASQVIAPAQFQTPSNREPSPGPGMGKIYGKRILMMIPVPQSGLAPLTTFDAPARNRQRLGHRRSPGSRPWPRTVRRRSSALPLRVSAAGGHRLPHRQSRSRPQRPTLRLASLWRCPRRGPEPPRLARAEADSEHGKKPRLSRHERKVLKARRVYRFGPNLERSGAGLGARVARPQSPILLGRQGDEMK